MDADGRRVPPGGAGELVVRGASVMRGYWGNPEVTAQWLRPGEIQGEIVLYTGDQFRTDDEGFLYFVGRSDDIFKCKGEKISPKEIEQMLYELDEIEEAAVIGVEDDIDGMAIKAVVSPSGRGQLDERLVRSHCRARLEAYMIPKHIEIRDSLPKTDSGKIRRSPSADPRPDANDAMKVLFAAQVARLDGGATQSLVALVSALADDDRFEPVVTVPRAGALSEALDARSIPWRVVRTPAWVAYTDPERTLARSAGP